MDNYNRLRVAYAGGMTKRWHAEDMIGEQLVNQHTWGLVSIILLLHPNPSLGLIKVAQFHDGPEPFSGDIPWFARKAVPGLQQGEDEISDRWFSAMGIVAELSASDSWWLKMADAGEAWLWCGRQQALGNRLAAPCSIELGDRLQEFLRTAPDTVAREAVGSVMAAGIAMGTRISRDINDLETL